MGKIVSLFDYRISKGHYDFSINFVGDDFIIQSANFVKESADPVILACIIADLRAAADILEESIDDCPTEVF